MTTTENQNENLDNAKCFYCDGKPDRIGNGYLVKLRKYGDNKGKKIHKHRCYNCFQGNYRNRKKTDEGEESIDRRYSRLRNGNRTFLIYGLNGRTRQKRGRKFKHEKVLGLNPVDFIKWLKYYCKYMKIPLEVDSDLLKFELDHFDPYKSTSTNIYKDRWDNIIPEIKEKNRKKKNKLPDKVDILLLKVIRDNFIKEYNIII